MVGGCGPLVAAALIAVQHPLDHYQARLARIGNGWLVAWLGAATVTASRAARAIDDGR